VTLLVESDESLHPAEMRTISNIEAVNTAFRLLIIDSSFPVKIKIYCRSIYFPTSLIRQNRAIVYYPFMVFDHCENYLPTKTSACPLAGKEYVHYVVSTPNPLKVKMNSDQVWDSVISL